MDVPQPSAAPVHCLQYEEHRGRCPTGEHRVLWWPQGAVASVRPSLHNHLHLELGKEFYYNLYITIRPKSGLVANLGLTEWQVKIWFQNLWVYKCKVK